MRELPAGRDALLLDFSGDPHPSIATLKAHSVLKAAMAAGSLPGILDVVPAAETVLVQAEPGGGLDELSIRRALRHVDFTEGAIDSSEVLEPIAIPVHYTGIDLDEVAQRCAMSVAEVIGAHTHTLWRVQFMGFAPGFGYLVPQQNSAATTLTALGRREQSRPSVPAGSVAVAAGYSAVYPRESPGGWWLLGSTDIALWNTDSEHPALLTPGAVVRFTDVRTDA
ncbi:UNVERIFIED_CONTAM: KipI family sensor histidine kinase inhibitor [Williamsia faeni]